MADQLEQLLRERLADVNEWLRFAEAKNGGLAAVALGATYAAADLLGSNDAMPLALRCYLFVAVVLTLVAACAALASFSPQLHKVFPYGAGAPDEDDNVLFFRDAAKHSPDSLVRAVQRLASLSADEPSALSKLLAQQVINNARIAERKFRSFDVGIWLAIAALITLPLAIVIYIVERVRRKEKRT
jgi:hypothetical protein